MSELKPLSCPFCGDAKIKAHVIRDGIQMLCANCHARGEPAFYGRTDQPSAHDRAITAWNRRAEGGAWRPIAEAPTETWLVTCRKGENGHNICRSIRWPDGDLEWSEQAGGRSTVTHHSFAAPTHYLCALPPPPEGER
jgi:hypothetical protein